MPFSGTTGTSLAKTKATGVRESSGVTSELSAFNTLALKLQALTNRANNKTEQYFT
jgi:hypothetical protein